MLNTLTRAELIDFKRALTDSEIANVLEDPSVRKGIAQLVNYRNPLRVNVPRMGPASAGQAAAVITRRAAGSTPAEFVSDTGSITEDTGTPTQVSFTYRTMATQMKVTRIAQLIGASYTDVFRQEAESKANDFANFEEKQFIVSSFGNNSVSFNGINALVPSGQVIKMTETADAAETLTERKLRDAIDIAKGVSPMFAVDGGQPQSIILTSEGGGREFDSLINTRQRVNDTQVMVKGGFRLNSYDRLPIFRTSTFGSAIYNNGSTKPNYAEITGSTGNSTVAFFLNFDELWVEELEPFHVVPLALVSSQYDTADMRETVTVVLRDTTAISMLTGIDVA